MDSLLKPQEKFENVHYYLSNANTYVPDLCKSFSDWRTKQDFYAIYRHGRNVSIHVLYSDTFSPVHFSS